MPYYDYAIASGHNSAGSLQNMETFISAQIGRALALPPVGTPVPAGSVQRIALDGTVTYNGAKQVTWTWAALPKAAFNALITTYLGSFDTGSAKVTIRTRGRDDTFGNYNAVMILPQVGTDYRRGPAGTVLDLNITFTQLDSI